jgi:hypothetical protein
MRLCNDRNLGDVRFGLDWIGLDPFRSSNDGRAQEEYNNYKVGWVRDCVTREDDWEESWCGVVAELLMTAEGPSHSTRLLLEGAYSVRGEWGSIRPHHYLFISQRLPRSTRL